MRDLLLTPDVPPVDFPEELRVTEEHPASRPKLVIRAPKRAAVYGQMLSAVLAFEYADRSIAFSKQERGLYVADTRRLLVRDREAEAAAVTLLRKLGFREARYYYNADADFELVAPSPAESDPCSSARRLVGRSRGQALSQERRHSNRSDLRYRLVRPRGQSAFRRSSRPVAASAAGPEEGREYHSAR